MHFLKTVFWALIAVLVFFFAYRNWTPVTLNLWNDIQADTKLPLLVLAGLVLGWLPTWLILRARIWGLRRRIEAMERNRVAGLQPDTPAVDEPEPVA